MDTSSDGQMKPHITSAIWWLVKNKAAKSLWKKQPVVANTIQLKPEATNKCNFLPIKLCFINVYNYPNPKP